MLPNPNQKSKAFTQHLTTVFIQIVLQYTQMCSPCTIHKSKLCHHLLLIIHHAIQPNIVVTKLLEAYPIPIKHTHVCMHSNLMLPWALNPDQYIHQALYNFPGNKQTNKHTKCNQPRSTHKQYRKNILPFSINNQQASKAWTQWTQSPSQPHSPLHH